MRRYEDLKRDENGHYVECNQKVTTDAIIQTKEFLVNYLNIKK